MAEMPAHRRAAILGRTAELIRERPRTWPGRWRRRPARPSSSPGPRSTAPAGPSRRPPKRPGACTARPSRSTALPAGEGYFGFYTRRPVGVIAAISPFNFPLNLVAHKVAPALAAGNSVVLKPATTTPISAVKLCEILVEAGVPAGRDEPGGRRPAARSASGWCPTRAWTKSPSPDRRPSGGASRRSPGSRRSPSSSATPRR